MKLKEVFGMSALKEIVDKKMRTNLPDQSVYSHKRNLLHRALHFFLANMTLIGF